MCDCYSVKCSNEFCETIIPVHIADYCTPRSNVEAYCELHLTPECNIFTVTEDDGTDELGYDIPNPQNVPYRVGFRIINKRKISKKSEKPFVSPNTSNWEQVS